MLTKCTFCTEINRFVYINSVHFLYSICFFSLKRLECRNPCHYILLLSYETGAVSVRIRSSGLYHLSLKNAVVKTNPINKQLPDCFLLNLIDWQVMVCISVCSKSRHIKLISRLKFKKKEVLKIKQTVYWFFVNYKI